MTVSYTFAELLNRERLQSLEKSNRINGCGVLVVEDNKILTGTRIDGKHRNQICGPGGHIEAGETPEEAAVREAYEEFGIECQDLKPLGILDGGRNYGKSAVFLCHEYDGEPQTDEEEMTDIQWRTIDELREERLFWPFEQSIDLIEDVLREAEQEKSAANTVNKFNPFHDRLGRFSNSNGASSVTIRTKDPNKQHWADRAIERTKQRQAEIRPTAAQEKTLNSIANKTRNLKKEQLRVVDDDGNVTFQMQGDKHSVNFTVGDARENFPGKITIHNHPDGGTFSADDLRTIGYGAKEIRVAAPEGDYIMRNAVPKGAKPTTMGWLGLQEALYEKQESFKSDRQLRKEVKANYQADYDEKVMVHAKNWLDAKNNGESEEVQQKYIKMYNDAQKAWEAENKPKIEKDVRNAYVKQYHNFYTENASKYELEYEFIPKKVRKGIFMNNEYEIEKSNDNGEIALDAEFNKMITEVTDSIINDLKSIND